MIVERSMSDGWLSNTCLVAAEPGGDAFLVDVGSPLDPLFAKAEEHGLNDTHPPDPSPPRPRRRARQGAGQPGPTPPCSRIPRSRCRGRPGDLNDGDEVEIGNSTVHALHTPGHTAGSLALADGNVFTGSTLFEGSVGGVRAPGGTSYDDLKRSIMEVLLKLPPDTTIRPGHTDPTTVADELESNRFVRIWRGLDPEVGGVHGAGRARYAGCCSATTTTAGTRPGCAGPTVATTSCQARVSR